jgi:hypothetical protein
MGSINERSTIRTSHEIKSKRIYVSFMIYSRVGDVPGARSGTGRFAVRQPGEIEELVPAGAISAGVALTKMAMFMKYLLLNYLACAATNRQILR